jgi:hypothetical protein
VSDIELPTAPFIVRYAEGRASREDIYDSIGAWHESGDQETRSLVEFLGMTEEEYDVWIMDSDTLPLIVAARRGEASLRDLVAKHYAEMRVSHPDYTSHIHALSYWLTGQPPA